MVQVAYLSDNREQVRVPFTMKVILCHNNLPVMNTQTLNISRDGVLLDTGHTIYDIHDKIDIEFQDIDGQSEQWYSLSAEVVHNSKHGLGLKFHKPSNMHALMSHMVLGKLYYLKQ